MFSRLGNGSLRRVSWVSQRSLMKDVRESLGSNVHHLVENAKGTIFGLMARNMNEKDVKKFFGHWNERVEDTPHTLETSAPKPVIEPARKTSKIEAPSSSAYVPLPFPDKIEAKMLYHPLLGELLFDVGYKKVYMTSVQALARTPVWKKQRILRPERAALIADDKVRKGMQQSLPGVITLYQDRVSKEVGIIDGQHRAGALMILAQRGHWDERKNNVVVEVFETEGEDSVAALFSAINAAEPVRLIDLPDSSIFGEEDDVESDAQSAPQSQSEPPLATDQQKTEESDTQNTPQSQSEPPLATDQQKTDPTPVTVPSTPSSDETAKPPTKKAKSREKKPSEPSLTPEQEKELITITVEALRAEYPDMFKPTSRCKIPHLNIDVLRDDLYSANVLRVRTFARPDDLQKQLRIINAALKEKFRQLQSESDVESQTFSKSFVAALNKAQKFDFYLGMEKDWIYDKSLWLKGDSE